MKLRADRFINLVYFMVRDALAHDEEKLREFERTLTSGQRSDGRPSWWTDDDDAGASSLAAAQALGLRF